jgi:hypothetical protein
MSSANSSTAHPNVRLHAKVSLSCVVGLGHFRVTGFVQVLGGARRTNGCGMSYGATSIVCL